MKNGLLLVSFLAFSLVANAQSPFGNEWIRPTQKYLKLSVTQAGVYRINYQTVKTADASFAQTNPTTWQLFFRGQEMAIRVVGEKDGVFNETDYVEFYGEGNDGSQDSLLYRPRKRLHPYQTLYSDTAAYFLTASPAGVGKRVAELNSPAQGLTPEPFHVEETVKAYTSQYTFNSFVGAEPFLQQSYFEPGEGWSGPVLTKDSVGNVQIKLTGRIAANWPITVEGMVNGRDNNEHQIQVQVGAATTPLTTLSSYGFASSVFQGVLTPAMLPNEQLNLRFIPAKSSVTNDFSITYVRLIYPQAVDMAGQPAKLFHIVPNQRGMALMNINNAPTGAVAYDITDRANCRYLTARPIDGQTQVVVSETGQIRAVFVTNQTAQPLQVKAVHFRNTFPKATDYVIVTHSSLRQSAGTYAAYRASDQGGRYTPLIIEADSLIDQFNYGEKGPLGLRRFANFMRVNSAVSNLLLIGRANSFPYSLKTATNDLVPTVGYPGSDILLTAGQGNFTANTPSIPTGRLNVTTNEQVIGYLEKVKQLESSTANGIWRKHIIHISGGKTPDEAQSLRSTLAGFGTIFTQGLLGGEISPFAKSQFVQEVENINIAPLVNDGVGLITFFGHAGPSVTDMNFGFASPVQNGFRNTNYPLMIFNGCGAGEIFSKFNTLSTDWLLAPQKGAGIVLAHSYYSYELTTAWYMNQLYTDLFNDPATLGMPFGMLQQRLNQNLEKQTIDSYKVSTLLEMVLQGDPALSAYPLPNPDFTVGKNGLYLLSSVAGSPVKSSDSLRVVIPLANIGKFVPGQSIGVTVKKTTATGVSSNTLRFTSFRYRDTLQYTVIRDLGLQKLEVVIDPDNKITELSKANNTATLVIDWTKAQGSSYPANALPDRVAPAINVFVNGVIRENKAVVNKNPNVAIYLLDQNSLSPQDTASVDVYLKSCETCNPQKISSKALSISAVSDNQLVVTTTLALLAGGNYQLIVFGKDAAGNQTQPPYVLNLTVTGSDETITFSANPNPATSYANFELLLNTATLPTASQFSIYSLSGAQVYSSTFPLEPGKNSFLWQGGAPGLYVYSLRLTWQDGRTETYTGKLIWQK